MFQVEFADFFFPLIFFSFVKVYELAGVGVGALTQIAQQLVLSVVRNFILKKIVIDAY